MAQNMVKDVALIRSVVAEINAKLEVIIDTNKSCSTNILNQTLPQKVLFVPCSSSEELDQLNDELKNEDYFIELVSCFRWLSV